MRDRLDTLLSALMGGATCGNILAGVGPLAIANELQSGPIVVTLQVLRLIMTVFAAGLVPRLIGWLDGT
ncbi:hypothetical protein A5724_19090 [Mycobacterium sp. ACS1612]|uniref:hypothetical protein n=1 Tax=Mycobacterium sp. ACS1612 TaxID=1834117 RepID=UPI0007FF3473|nr:hypothetical protein [Mycobacterium sp. ACS1612]OBF33659.1 hypothetical protein A5724_19090 [Mycobacterium sp. ACS1612]